MVTQVRSAGNAPESQYVRLTSKEMPNDLNVKHKHTTNEPLTHRSLVSAVYSSSYPYHELTDPRRQTTVNNPDIL